MISMLTLYEPIGFGKYTDRTFMYVLTEKLSYAEWLVENQPHRLSVEVQSFILSLRNCNNNDEFNRLFGMNALLFFVLLLRVQ